MRQREAVQSDNGPERRLHDAFLIAPAAIANRRTANLAKRQRPTANFPKMGIAKCQPISREPNDRKVAQKGPLATSHSPLATSISNRELTMRQASASRASAQQRTTRGICSAISNRELTMRRASASRASAPRRTMRGISPLSNRELFGLEISQLVENKHPRPILIANFEPNDFFDFRAFVSAALLPRGAKARRAGFRLSLGARELAGRSRKSSQRSGCSK
jgi:hypothetical protein